MRKGSRLLGGLASAAILPNGNATLVVAEGSAYSLSIAAQGSGEFRERVMFSVGAAHPGGRMSGWPGALSKLDHD